MRARTGARAMGHRINPTNQRTTHPFDPSSSQVRGSLLTACYQEAGASWS